MFINQDCLIAIKLNAVASKYMDYKTVFLRVLSQYVEYFFVDILNFFKIRIVSKVYIFIGDCIGQLEEVDHIFAIL